MHLPLRNEAAVDTVNACLKGGADVRAVNARGEHCVGGPQGARPGGPAPRQLRDGHGRGRRAAEVAAQVAQLVDKKAAQGGAPPRISMGTPQKSGPSTPKSPGRRLVTTPNKRGAPVAHLGGARGRLLAARGRARDGGRGRRRG